MKEKNIAKKTAFYGILGALALGLSFLEGQLLPDLPFLPVGAKPGLSNIVTMLAASVSGFGGAIYITLIKATFAFVSRGGTAFLMSLAGGLLSTVAMCLLLPAKKQVFSLTGVGIVSAVLHNLAQLAVACLVTGTSAILGYAPFLLLFSLLTGFVTGTILRVVMPKLDFIKHIT